MGRIKTRIRAVCLALAAGSAQAQPASFRDAAPAAIAPLAAPFAMTELRRPEFPEVEFNIKDYGAVEGGTVKNTEAIKQTIAAAVAAGGGSVVVPAGKWLTGPIHLESRINLRVEKGATLLFSQDRADYRPGVFARHEGIECIKYSPFIYAFEKENIAVTGEGVLEGQGDPWWTMPEQQGANQRLARMVADGVAPRERIFDGSTDNGGLRPEFFSPVHCKNVLVEGIEFRFGAFWTVAPIYCENVVIRKVKITTWETDERRMPNGDGIAPESCKNMLIEYCDLQTKDDLVAIKSGKDADGLRVAIPSENVVIRNINGPRGGGGIVIGSETSGIVRNMVAPDCVFGAMDRGILFKTGRGRGGGFENIWCENIKIDSANVGIDVTMRFGGGQNGPARAVDASTPFVRNLNFKGIECKTATANTVVVRGLPERHAEKIVFDGVKIGGTAAPLIEEADGVEMKDSAVGALPAA